jgi:hypothetical protein
MRRATLGFFACVATMCALASELRVAWAAAAAFTTVYCAWLLVDGFKAALDAHVALRIAANKKLEREERERRRHRDR